MLNLEASVSTVKELVRSITWAIKSMCFFSEIYLQVQGYKLFFERYPSGIMCQHYPLAYCEKHYFEATEVLLVVLHDLGPSPCCTWNSQVKWLNIIYRNILNDSGLDWFMKVAKIYNQGLYSFFRFSIYGDVCECIYSFQIFLFYNFINHKLKTCYPLVTHGILLIYNFPLTWKPCRISFFIVTWW